MIIHRPGQKIHFVPGIGINVITPQSAAEASWWLSGGISAENVAGVWQAKGAASLAASYLRLAGDQGYANIDPAIVGGVAPAWDATNGWTGNGTAYLKTGIVPDNNYSIIVKFSYTAPLSGGDCWNGVVETAPSLRYFALSNPRSDNKAGYGASGPIQVVAPSFFHGTIAIAGRRAYRNGVDEGISLVDSGVPLTRGIYILARNLDGTADSKATNKFSVQSIAIYKNTITAPQMLAVHTAVVAL
jgi:hypothetical protein